MSTADRSAEIALRTFVAARWVLLGLIGVGWSVQHASPAAFEQITSWFPPPPEPTGTAAVMVSLALLNLATQRWILGGAGGGAAGGRRRPWPGSTSWLTPPR